ncbi:hypothetical protein PRZ48_013054 [Zasmidium cellare]|uniref:Transmembrane protein n=1 Tax=Zasmidium cellare TaxID=395010 RepID=A0ABR0E3H5_ZASCE|nr:hypothetical protein PRZ48_013054 [Zasmidium cellare]
MSLLSSLRVEKYQSAEEDRRDASYIDAPGQCAEQQRTTGHYERIKRRQTTSTRGKMVPLPLIFLIYILAMCVVAEGPFDDRSRVLASKQIKDQMEDMKRFKLEKFEIRRRRRNR